MYYIHFDSLLYFQNKYTKQVEVLAKTRSTSIKSVTLTKMQESHIPEKYYAFINEKVDRQKNKKLESEVN